MSGSYFRVLDTLFYLYEHCLYITHYFEHNKHDRVVSSIHGPFSNKA